MVVNVGGGLTEMQQQLSEIVQHGVIDPNFKYNDEDFEILSTLRYDPRFTIGSNTAEFEPNQQPCVDPRLSIYDLHEVLYAEGNSPQDDYPIEAVSQLLSDVQKGVPPISPPPEQDLNFDNDELALRKVFFNRFLLLGEQYKRLNLALDYFKWDLDISIDVLLEQLINAIPCPVSASQSLQSRMKSLLFVEQCYKMRVLVSSSGKMRIEAHELPSSFERQINISQYFVKTILKGFLTHQDEVWDIFIDSQPITASPFTTFKTTRRDHYNAARKRMTEMAAKLANPAPKCEVLVYNNAHELMEGSITNVALLKTSKESENPFYQTPYLSTGCLCGVMRYYLLKKSLINEGHIDVRDLRPGDQMLLFNGVMGCVKGIVRNSLD